MQRKNSMTVKMAIHTTKVRHGGAIHIFSSPLMARQMLCLLQAMDEANLSVSLALECIWQDATVRNTNTREPKYMYIRVHCYFKYENNRNKYILGF